jgi:hypothetical protein
MWFWGNERPVAVIKKNALKRIGEMADREVFIDPNIINRKKNNENDGEIFIRLSSFDE